ncbi:hypothetical protein FRUB_04267 [Fimbriiglobus ruber]|uniref:Uncharacterized protein n=1 Tax=Fimbriiglobus ruber TaxID=1908690 RepID=A0A225DY62_9BACT|nr:hypothetical protein FRUB_04267 [Fimbriiglobus ruber]
MILSVLNKYRGRYDSKKMHEMQDRQVVGRIQQKFSEQDDRKVCQM